MNNKKHIGQYSYSGLMWRSYYFFIITFSLLFLASCHKDEVLPPSSASFNYFPTEQGRFVIYDVDSIVHSTNDSNNDDSVYYFHFQLKDVIDAPFVDGEGKTRQKILRYYRADTASSWVIRNVWSQLLTTQAAYRYEDNVAYHKMAFPINSKIEWNGNDKNIYGEEFYSYESIHESQSYNNSYFDSTVAVLQVDQDDYIERIYGTEVYANNVGLVYKQRDDLRKNIGLVVSGTEYKMTVVSYGKE